MPDLIAIIYPDPGTASKAMEHVDWAAFDKQVNVIDACCITNEDGAVVVRPGGHPVLGRAVIGGTLGFVLGAVFALPVAGLAAGAALGARRGAKKEKESDDPFVESIKVEVAMGGSALVVLYDEGTATENAGADLLEFGGTIRSKTMSAERLEEIQARLDLA
ncbi:MAG: DUF1269 domain-containing protein [Thermomicrobiales bacterium]|nr:MAG: DUF1269 domain-containing protein [Thermomicrobiales bacterium]